MKTCDTHHNNKQAVTVYQDKQELHPQTGAFLKYLPRIHSMKTQTQNGYTLIELMVTLGIAGILFAIALPNLSGFIKGDRLVAARNTLSNDLMLARSKAVESNQAVFLCASTDGVACTASAFENGWIILQDTDRNKVASATDTLIKVQQPITGSIEFKLSDPTLSTITIDGRGFTPDSTGIISVCDKANSGNPKANTLSISRTGRPSRGAAPAC